MAYAGPSPERSALFDAELEPETHGPDVIPSICNFRIDEAKAMAAVDAMLEGQGLCRIDPAKGWAFGNRSSGSLEDRGDALAAADAHRH